MQDGPLVELDTRAVAKLARDLKVAEPALRRELLARMRGAGRIVQEAVKEEASFSTRIPQATYVRSTYAVKGARIRVGVDKNKAPEARPINNNDREGTFRHPVWADTTKTRAQWTWVSQTAQPFMGRAANRTREEVTAAVLEVYEDVAHRAGFHGI